ncbi:MAG: PASTA domain-containing protein [Dehalococcoidia bacterium]
MIFTKLKSRILFESASFFLVLAVLLSSTSTTVFAGSTRQWSAIPLQPTAQQAVEPVCGLYPITLHISLVEAATPGDELVDILSGTQPGNFGWLSWTGDPSSPALATALTPPGNSDTYVNPTDSTDHLVSIGDSVEGVPSITNSAAVGDALDNLKGVLIEIPIWDSSLQQGNNTVYHIVRFALVEITGYHLPSENRISAIFHDFARCEPPVASDDLYEISEDNPLNVTAPGVLGNDSDAEGDALTAVLVSGSSNGALVLKEDGSFDYTPATDFHGEDSFTYKANDGRLDSNIATVTITVHPAAFLIVPNVVALPQGEAEAVIESAGLTVGSINTANSTTMPAGDVIIQSPLAGTSVALGSAVNLVVSLGLAQVEVPDVVGLPQAAARDTIVAAGLTVGTINTANSTTVPAGDVISQSPLAGTLAALDSAVNLMVSLGPVQVQATPAIRLSDCSNGTPSVSILWPPNHKFAAINVLGVTGPDGDAATITIDSIFQDEPVDARSSGNTDPDGLGVGTATAQVRTERSGSGNGRVYHIGFTADYGDGDGCSGTVLVGVPHDRGKKGRVPVDEGPLFDSTGP